MGKIVRQGQFQEGCQLPRQSTYILRGLLFSDVIVHFNCHQGNFVTVFTNATNFVQQSTVSCTKYNTIYKIDSPLVLLLVTNVFWVSSDVAIANGVSTNQEQKPSQLTQNAATDLGIPSSLSVGYCQTHLKYYYKFYLWRLLSPGKMCPHSMQVCNNALFQIFSAELRIQVSCDQYSNNRT